MIFHESRCKIPCDPEGGPRPFLFWSKIFFFYYNFTLKKCLRGEKSSQEDDPYIKMTVIKSSIRC